MDAASRADAVLQRRDSRPERLVPLLRPSCPTAAPPSVSIPSCAALEDLWGHLTLKAKSLPAHQRPTAERLQNVLGVLHADQAAAVRRCKPSIPTRHDSVGVSFPLNVRASCMPAGAAAQTHARTRGKWRAKHSAAGCTAQFAAQRQEWHHEMLTAQKTRDAHAAEAKARKRRDAGSLRLQRSFYKSSGLMLASEGPLAMKSPPPPETASSSPPPLQNLPRLGTNPADVPVAHRCDSGEAAALEKQLRWVDVLSQQPGGATALAVQGTLPAVSQLRNSCFSFAGLSASDARGAEARHGHPSSHRIEAFEGYLARRASTACVLRSSVLASLLVAVVSAVAPGGVLVPLVPRQSNLFSQPVPLREPVEHTVSKRKQWIENGRFPVDYTPEPPSAAEEIVGLSLPPACIDPLPDDPSSAEDLCYHGLFSRKEAVLLETLFSRKA